MKRPPGFCCAMFGPFSCGGRGFKKFHWLPGFDPGFRIRRGKSFEPGEPPRLLCWGHFAIAEVVWVQMMKETDGR